MSKVFQREEWDWIRFGVMLLCITMLAAVLLPTGRAVSAPTPQEPRSVNIYSGRLADGWQDWSWAKHDLQSADVLRDGRVAIKMEPASFTGVYLHSDAVDTRGLKSLWVWVHGGKRGGQKIDVCAVDSARKFGPKVDLGSVTSVGSIPAGRWTLAIVPLSRLNAAGTVITGFVFQESAGKTQEAVYLADLKLVADTSAASSSSGGVGSCTVEVDTSRDAHPISPFIYGMAHTSEEMLRELRLGSHRWGGNANTRYNWEINAWNHARDWEFSNYGDPKAEARSPGKAADDFVAANRKTGVLSVMTVPTIGYVAKDISDSSRSLNVPKEGGLPSGPGSEAIAGYDPSENRRRTSVRSYARKRSAFEDPPSPSDGAVYQDEWISHLVRKFGKASEGGVQVYAMDNEPDLWDGTHTDVHPARMSYDDLLSRYLEYAAAVKAVDPTAKIAGPVSWGWTGYFHSPRDRDQWSARPDRKAHGDTPFLPWFLEQVKKHDERTGKRSLDILDIHYYPQGAGVFSDRSDAVTDALRVRSTRALWDPSYKDESWIGEPVNLLPRMKAWIDASYPGTKLGLTEWNWGGEGSMSGAVAIAECLGVFGRENLYLANYWTAPKPRTPAYFAFKIFRSADGKGAGLGDRSARAVSTSPNDVSCFASVDSATGQPVLLVVNKQADRDVIVTIRLRHDKAVSRVERYRYSQSDLSGIEKLPDGTVSSNSFLLEAPRYSLTLLRFK